MDREAIRAFAERRWDLVEAAKLRFRAERYLDDGPAKSLAVLGELRERWRRVHPDGSTGQARAADLDHHVRLAALLRRTGDALARR